MKTTRSSLLRSLAAGAALCGLGFPAVSYAQPAPAKAKPAAKKPAAPRAAAAPKTRGKNFTPRMVTATEAAMGKPLTPAQKEQLTTALRAREAAIQAANDAYYVIFAQTTGLTPEQAKEVDKPSRKTTKAPTEAKVVGQTNLDALTDTNVRNEPVPVSPTPK